MVKFTVQMKIIQYICKLYNANEMYIIKIQIIQLLSWLLIMALVKAAWSDFLLNFVKAFKRTISILSMCLIKGIAVVFPAN